MTHAHHVHHFALSGHLPLRETKIPAKPVSASRSLLQEVIHEVLSFKDDWTRWSLTERLAVKTIALGVVDLALYAAMFP